MLEFNNIVLCAGTTKSENIPVGYFSSIAMLPLRGKPIIWWLFESLKDQGIKEIILVLNKNNIKLVEYVKSTLSNNFKINIILISDKKSILDSLNAGLKATNLQNPTRVILGDTLITKSISDERDVLYTSKDVGFSENWCLLDTKEDGTINNFFDKQKNINPENKETLVGYYSFSNTKLIYSCVRRALFLRKKEISAALSLYKKKIKLKSKIINDWYDLGHTSGLIKAKNVLFNARSFNSITVDTDLGTLTKKSSNIQKLEDEAIWYESLPNELKILTPRFISFKKYQNYAEFVQELYGYPSLSELFLSGEVNLDDWKIILTKLFKLHKYLEKYEAPTDSSSLNWLYKEKTFARIEELKNQNASWSTLLEKEYITINNKIYENMPLLADKISNFSDILSKNYKKTIMHGDYCFSNILFDSSNYTFKLIDPRGRLNKEATIYGDPRYDIAKLRHSVCGLYDFIVNGLFYLEESENSFNYKILSTNDYSALEPIFNELIDENGFNSEEIKFIEGLLFLSMIPLHKDDIKRQKIFYLKAVTTFNDILKTTDVIKNKQLNIQK